MKAAAMDNPEDLVRTLEGRVYAHTTYIIHMYILAVGVY